jgi:hypothetical protein
MHVPNTARRSVVFVGDQTDAGVFRPRATAFLVGVPSQKSNHWFPYLVTAAHVVERCQRLQKQMFCRVNLKNGGGSVAPLIVNRWWLHPELATEATDVAVASIGADWDVVDHDCIPMPEKWEANPIALGRRDIGLGDETFAIGLFRNHAGQERNIPIVRIGNVAALPEELVSTPCGDVKAYLVEMRSIAGLSGSPVFVDLPSTQPFLLGIPDTRYKPPDPEQVNWFRYRFLGLVQGHFDILHPEEDSVLEDINDHGGGINSGSAIIIPADKIIETLYQPKLRKERRQIEAQFSDRQATEIG